jgi:hypothetical protein
MDHRSLRATLRVLREHGVVSATFDADGGISAVQFAGAPALPLAPPAPPKKETVDPRQTSFAGVYGELEELIYPGGAPWKASQ